MLDYISIFAPPDTITITGFECCIMDKEAMEYYEEQQTEVDYSNFRADDYLKEYCPF